MKNINNDLYPFPKCHLPSYFEIPARLPSTSLGLVHNVICYQEESLQLYNICISKNYYYYYNTTTMQYQLNND